MNFATTIPSAMPVLQAPPKDSPLNLAATRQPRFGNAAAVATGLAGGAAAVGGATALSGMGLANQAIARMYNWFETSYEPGFILLSKIFGNVIPRTVICRNANERSEVAFNEVTQGATLFLSLPFFAPIANGIQAALYGTKDGMSGKLIKMENGAALAEALKDGGEVAMRRLQVLKLGKSFAVSVMAGAALMAITYYRNYRTIKRTGFADYKKVVGLGGNQPPTPEERADADKAARRNLNIIAGLMASGAVIAVGLMAGAARMAKLVPDLLKKIPGSLSSRKDWRGTLDHLMKHWSLVGNSSNQINSVFKSTKQTLWVWGIPSYAAWLLACRDTYEVVEQMSKFITFCAGYIGVPKLTAMMRNKLDTSGWFNKGGLIAQHLMKDGPNGTKVPAYNPTQTYTELIHNFDKVVQNVPKGETAQSIAQKAIRLWNTNNMAVLALNLFVIGAVPILFNIAFSAWRHKHEKLPRTPFRVPETDLRRYNSALQLKPEQIIRVQAPRTMPAWQANGPFSAS